MARTYKDRPSRVRFPEVYPYWVEVEKSKKKRHVDTEWHWMGTPGWWIHLMMTKPQRRAGSLWERDVVKADIDQLDNFDKPSISRKPHRYYW